MKKYFKLMITALIVLVVAPSVVFANDLCGDQSNNTCFESNNQNVLMNGVNGPNSIVGNVEGSTIYYVSIDWDNDTFDWVYNENSLTYEWDGTGVLEITDASVNGHVTPSLSWTSENKYSATSASFYYLAEVPTSNCVAITYEPGGDYYEQMIGGHLYNDSGCTTPASDTGEIKTVYMIEEGTDLQRYTFSGEVPAAGRIYNETDNLYSYMLGYNLVVDNTQIVPTPTTNDIIGHYTVTFATSAN